jgi:hypothetical protein
MAQRPNERATKEERLRRRSNAAEYIQSEWGIPCATKTLAKLAVIGGGPVFRKAGRIPLYPQDALDDWALSKLGPRVRSTSELSGAHQGHDAALPGTAATHPGPTVTAAQSSPHHAPNKVRGDVFRPRGRLRKSSSAARERTWSP